MASLKPIVEAVWRQLDLPPPLEDIGDTYSFELSDTPIEMAVQANGRTVTVRGMIGFLPGDGYKAQGLLSQIMRFGTGLMATNQAALEIPDAAQLRDEESVQPIEVFVVAQAQLQNPDSAVQALREIIAWRGYAEPVLGETGVDANDDIAPAPETAVEDSMVIFRP